MDGVARDIGLEIGIRWACFSFGMAAASASMWLGEYLGYFHICH